MLTVLFFARLREQLGQSQVTLPLTQATSVRQVVEQLIAEHPQWQKPLAAANILAAVNQQVVTQDTLVNNGDELAFFPPVTGG
ncbi:molybdopterin converting factor subunit 1 [Thalassotalea euphylliae]|uniref:Molybdopterin synthase sulfur carrier subunit n=1 Tax=Thalassotalea euphylliae TaxID=1655234 RepID=A0A3E0TMK5_9GAMM|nr:molybdopterin converting factor subunit 1 [Thalassotalea euphylliae]REL25799.1 molybdopterin converting factor subunit 1 [Thalassotalea euphylliae]